MIQLDISYYLFLKDIIQFMIGLLNLLVKKVVLYTALIIILRE